MASSSPAYPTVSPYLVVDDVAALIQFATVTFGAEEVDRRARSDGSIVAASIRIGDSVVMMAERDATSCSTDRVHLYVGDVWATYRRALEAGAASLSEPVDVSEGECRAGVEGPCGTQWWFSTAPEGMSPCH